MNLTIFGKITVQGAPDQPLPKNFKILVVAWEMINHIPKADRLGQAIADEEGNYRIFCDPGHLVEVHGGWRSPGIYVTIGKWKSEIYTYVDRTQRLEIDIVITLPSPEPQPTKYDWEYFQEKLVLDERINTHINRKLHPPDSNTRPEIPGGGKILLAGTEVRVAEGFTFELCDVDLVILADTLECGTGSIRLCRRAMTNVGQQGLKGMELVVACQKLVSIDVESKGGKGGPGKMGAPGEPGKEGGDEPGNLDGGPGGRGGIGDHGATGGVGGDVTVCYVDGEQPGSDRVRSSPGDGGDGGPGGPGGSGGPGGIWIKPGGSIIIEGKQGKQGPVGMTGRPGKPGSPGLSQVAKLSLEDFWKKFGLMAGKWATFRTRVGEYYYRAYNKEGNPPCSLRVALNEFDNAVSMDSSNRQASAYRDQLNSALNILGLPREHDIIPEFSKYEGVYIDYYPMADSAQKSAILLLDQSISLDQKIKELDQQIYHLQRLQDILELEKASAAIGASAAKEDLSQASARVEQIRNELSARREELEKHDVTFGEILGTVFTVGSLIAGIVSGGASIIPFCTSLAGIGGAVLSGNSIDLMGEALKPKDEQSDEFKSLLDNAKGLKEAVAALKGGYAAIISFDKMLSDMSGSYVDDEEYRRLLCESAEAAHARLLASMRNEQAKLALKASQDKCELARKDKEHIDALRQQLQETQTGAQEAGFMLLRMSQHALDILMKYTFYAARALEIYTLEDKSSCIRFDYGHIHPDWEIAFQEGFVDLPTLRNAYDSSWHQFTEIVRYRDDYLSYFASGDWSSDYCRRGFAEQDILARFKSTHTLNFSVDLNEMPLNRYEAKVDAVYVGMVGAKAKNGVCSVVVEHSGKYSEKKRDGSVASAILNPRSTIVQAVTGSLPAQTQAKRDEAEPPDVSFWRRGIATNWHVYVEDAEVQSVGLDLSELQELEVWIRYKCFLGNKIYASGTNSLNDGTLLREKETGVVYVMCGGAKLLVREVDLPKVPITPVRKIDEFPARILACIPGVPRDGTVFRTRESRTIFAIYGGVKYEISEFPAKFAGGGRDINEVGECSLAGIPSGGKIDDLQSPPLGVYGLRVSHVYSPDEGRLNVVDD